MDQIRPDQMDQKQAKNADDVFRCFFILWIVKLTAHLSTCVAISKTFIINVFSSIIIGYFKVHVAHIWRDLNPGIVPFWI